MIKIAATDKIIIWVHLKKISSSIISKTFLPSVVPRTDKIIAKKRKNGSGQFSKLKEINKPPKNIIFDKLGTEELLSSELANISLTNGLILSGQVIINRGELVDAEKYQVLLSLKQKYEGAMWGKGASFLVLFGQFILVGISLLILWLFLRQYREYMKSPDNSLRNSLGNFTRKLHREFPKEFRA